MTINNEFDLSQMVYLRHDLMQSERMVIGIMVSKYDITYRLISGTEESYHYDFEISEEKTIY